MTAPESACPPSSQPAPKSGRVTRNIGCRVLPRVDIPSIALTGLYRDGKLSTPSRFRHLMSIGKVIDRGINRLHPDAKSRHCMGSMLMIDEVSMLMG